MIKLDNLGDNKSYEHFMKGQSPLGELQNETESRKLYRIKNKEKTRRKYLLGWDHIVTLVWVRKPRVDSAGVSFPDILHVATQGGDVPSWA